MGKVRDTIVDAGITPSKVGACFIVHEALGVTILFGSWFLCYRLLKNKQSQKALNRLSQHKSYSAGKKWVERKLKPLATSNGEKLIISGALSIVARKLCTPLLVPGKIIVSVALVKYMAS